MFILELLGRLAGPEILAAIAALFTALGPAIVAIAKKRERQDTTDASDTAESSVDDRPVPSGTTAEFDLKDIVSFKAAHTQVSGKLEEESGETTKSSDDKTVVHYYHADAPAQAGKLNAPLAASPKAASEAKPTTRTEWVRVGHRDPAHTPGIEAAAPPVASRNRGSTMLVCYAVVLVVFGAFAAVHYWDAIRQSQDLAFTMVGLLLTMVAGMFVQVISCNYRASAPLFHVTGSQLAYPLLFSPIVFYPVWALTTGGSQHLFAFYAAFLDGYFWESVVSSAKSVTVETPNGDVGTRGPKRRRRLPVTPQPA